MQILVTGGAGYIGSHTCVELLNAGHEIIVVDNLCNSKEESLKRVKQITGKEFKFYKVHLQERENLEAIFTENEIKAVIHFAGLKAVDESGEIPLTYYLNNITGTIILCEVLKKFGVHNLVFSSSATVYGLQDVVPFHEEMSLQATNPYGRTKLMVEEMLRDLYTSNNIWSIALLRYFNPIGAHPSGLIGEDPNGIPNNLLPYISQVGVGKLKELQIYGGDYQTPDGTGVRDYIHVVDLARGHLNAFEKVVRNKGVHAYNLGTGKGYSVLEMVAAYEKASGQQIPYRIVERRKGDLEICYADPSKAKRELKWLAEKGIDEMCRDACHWQSKNRNGYEKEKVINVGK